MNPLVLNFLFLVILGFFCSFPKPKKSKNKFFVLISFSTLLFLRTFVDIQSVPDLHSYILGFKQMIDVDFLKVPITELYYVKIPEIGFRYLMKICGLVSSSFVFFLFVYGLLWLCGYIKVMKSYSPYIILSILFLVVGNFNQSIFVIRQHLAIVVVFLSYKYIIEKKLLKYLLIIFLAFMLHQATIIVLPLYFLYHVNGRKKIILTIISCAVFIYFNFAYFLAKMGTEVLQGYASYVESDIKTNSTLSFIIGIELLLYILILKKNILNKGINKLLFLSLSMGLVISICGIGFNPTSRMVMYYTSVSFLTVPIMVKYAKSSLVKNLIILLFLSLYTYMTFFGSGFVFLSDFRLDL
ncbi:UNVERIFIED_CONTAM: EpsG family protein [Prevotella sp. 15_C9]